MVGGMLLRQQGALTPNWCLQAANLAAAAGSETLTAVRENETFLTDRSSGIDSGVADNHTNSIVSGDSPLYLHLLQISSLLTYFRNFL